jgi:acetyl-CoA carboxylase carboxyltransferase component
MIVLRKGYGLGAMAMATGHLQAPLFTVAWPTAELGPMGLEGAVKLAHRRALEAEPELSGAHYGLAFLLLKKGDRTGAEKHLNAFLAKPPSGAEAERWVRHAEETLDTLRGEALADGSEP